MYNDITYKDIFNSFLISISLILAFSINLLIVNSICDVFNIDKNLSVAFALPSFNVSLTIIFTFIDLLIVYKMIKK